MSAVETANALAEGIRSSMPDDPTAQAWANTAESLARDYAAMVGRVKAKLHEVTICADPQDGNDAVEVSITLPYVPRKGDAILVAQGDSLDVKAVAAEAWPGGRIEVWVEMASYSLDELLAAIEAIRERYDS